MEEIGVDISSDIEVDDIRLENIEEKDVSDEEIEPEELERRMWKDRIKLKRLKEKKKIEALQAAEKQKSCRPVLSQYHLFSSSKSFSFSIRLEPLKLCELIVVESFVPKIFQIYCDSLLCFSFVLAYKKASIS